MWVQSATFSCSVKLCKQWFTLEDFFPNLEFSRGFLYVYLIYIAGRISAAAMGAGDIIFFSLASPVENYTGNIINQSLNGPVERHMHSGTEVVLVREGPRAGGAPHSGKRGPTISRLL
jgi:hypothetical protein